MWYAFLDTKHLKHLFLYLIFQDRYILIFVNKFLFEEKFQSIKTFL